MKRYQKVESKFEQIGDTLSNIVEDNNEEVDTNESQWVNVEFSCEKFEGLYKQKGIL